MEEARDFGSESTEPLGIVLQVEDPKFGVGILKAIRQLPADVQENILAKLEQAQVNGVVPNDAARSILDAEDPILYFTASGEGVELSEFENTVEVRQAAPEPPQIFPPGGAL